VRALVAGKLEESVMQNGKPTTTDVDSGRLRVKKTNRPLPRCADEDLGFGTVRARYSERWERREAPAC